ncbi:outer membrane beta-barrel protein [Helicobacter sp. T3_23-1059]
MSLYTGRNLQGELTSATYSGYYSNWNDHTAIPINIFGGYQWYFYDRPWFHFGVRVRGHIGYSNYNTKMSDYNSLYSTNVDFALSSHAIQYGVEAQFLWDFLNMGQHTLGWHFAPIGLEGSTFFDKFSITASGNAQGTGEYDTNIHTKFSYVWNTGLHYYFNAKHMVFATYKYRGYSSGYQTAGKGQNSIRYYNYSNNSFMLGYAYKF